MLESGYLKLFSVRGIPVRAHWTLPLGALMLGGMRLSPGFWLGFVLIILLHELGHAYLVRRLNHHVVAVDITGFGGACRWQPRGYASQLEHSIISWGGVLAQGLLLLGTVIALAVVGSPSSVFTAELVHAFTTTNIIIIVINLLPFPPLDGYQAWKIFGQLKQASQLEARGKRKAPSGKLEDAARAWRAPRPEPSKKARRRAKQYAHVRPVEDEAEGNLSSESKVELAKLFEKLASDAAEARKGGRDKPN